MRSPGGGRDGAPGVRSEEERAEAVATTREQVGGGKGEGVRVVTFEATRRAPIERSAGVEQKPHIESPVCLREAHERMAGARTDVPIDVAHVFSRLVLTQLRELEAGRAHERALLAAQRHC